MVRTKPQNDTDENKKLAEQIRDLQKEKEYVQPRDDHIFPEDPEQFIEQSSTNHLANWLRIYPPTIFNSKICQIISNELRRTLKRPRAMIRDTDNENEQRQKNQDTMHTAKEKKQDKEHAPRKRPATKYHTVHFITDRLILSYFQTFGRAFPCGGCRPYVDSVSLSVRLDPVG